LALEKENTRRGLEKDRNIEKGTENDTIEWSEVPKHSFIETSHTWVEMGAKTRSRIESDWGRVGLRTF
jgi:hypothetical protein